MTSKGKSRYYETEQYNMNAAGWGMAICFPSGFDSSYFGISASQANKASGNSSKYHSIHEYSRMDKYSRI